MKVNQMQLNKKDKEFEIDLSYLEWLECNKDLTVEDIDNMEKVICKASILKNHKKPVNHIQFQPLEGA